jgi:hypothetical protein
MVDVAHCPQGASPSLPKRGTMVDACLFLARVLRFAEAARIIVAPVLSVGWIASAIRHTFVFFYLIKRWA